MLLAYCGWVLAADNADPSKKNTQDTTAAQQLATEMQDNPDFVDQLSQALDQGQSKPNVSKGKIAPSSQPASAKQPDPKGKALSSNGNATDKVKSNGNATQDEPDKPGSAAYEQQLNKDAFRSIQQEAFPLSPNQIKTLHNMLDDTQRATASAPFEQPPEPTSSSLFVKLAPGTVPPVIRLSKGFVTSLVFIDSTGAPWPIEAYDLGNPTTFNISWNKKDNTLMVQARSTYTYGNLAIKLVDLNTPVMLTLIPGQKIVDYRVDLRVQGMGPNAKPSIQGAGMPAAANPLLLNILDGVGPEGGTRLQVQGDLGDAWLYEGKMYLRSRLTLLSPAWFAKMSSADGTHAYELQVAPMVLMSHQGKPVQLRVEGL